MRVFCSCEVVMSGTDGIVRWRGGRMLCPGKGPVSLIRVGVMDAMTPCSDYIACYLCLEHYPH